MYREKRIRINNKYNTIRIFPENFPLLDKIVYFIQFIALIFSIFMLLRLPLFAVPISIKILLSVPIITLILLIYFICFKYFIHLKILIEEYKFKKDFLIYTKFIFIFKWSKSFKLNNMHVFRTDLESFYTKFSSAKVPHEYSTYGQIYLYYNGNELKLTNRLNEEDSKYLVNILNEKLPLFKANNK